MAFGGLSNPRFCVLLSPALTPSRLRLPKSSFGPPQQKRVKRHKDGTGGSRLRFRDMRMLGSRKNQVATCNRISPNHPNEGRWLDHSPDGCVNHAVG